MKTRLLLFCAGFSAVLGLTLFLHGASTPSANYIYGTNGSNVGGYYAPVTVPITFTAAGISAGSTGDLATVATGLSRYIVQAVYAETTAASGTLALATIDIRTATGGGGTSILAAPTALAALAAVDLAQSITPLTLGAVQTAANLTLRQTVLSANAGTISVVVVLIPLP